MIYVGIDPGRKTGLAVYDSLTKRLELTTLDFWKLIDFFNNSIGLYSKSNFQVEIEDPTGNKPVFPKKLNHQSFRSALKIAQNVGMNKQEAVLIFEYLERKGVRFNKRTPGKESITKINPKYFSEIFGEVRCSEHARDAAMLILKYIDIKKVKTKVLKLAS